MTEEERRPRKSENFLPSLGEGKGWDGIEDREITEHHAIMDNLSLSVAFFPLCLFLLLEIPDRSRMCYSHVVLEKAIVKLFAKQTRKEGQLWGVTWVVGAGGCAGVMTTFENPQFRSLFYIWRCGTIKPEKNKAQGGY